MFIKCLVTCVKVMLTVFHRMFGKNNSVDKVPLCVSLQVITDDDRCPTVFLQLMLIIIKVFIKHKILSIETKCEHAHTQAPTHLSILATQN